ncbi:divergent polysaccharide deacetylase family protein [Maritimibacter dapengensis]|uniref:Divergent polysaccharide deacetylase family protein n=1 Tax=Maritimibacter dapengensis TaxID=2836868 RepID=A0ABS6T1M0_9RHOB|nr:polysaccharide deacteylase family 2 protein [Maritimibacter dapengensis]MBV7378481.1 divergent polysaccharide deacetylase family protein [Maritimibacter dapengensis]
MARGTISGVLWGAVVSAIGIFTAAFVVEPVVLPVSDDSVAVMEEAAEAEAEVSEADAGENAEAPVTEGEPVDTPDDAPEAEPDDADAPVEGEEAEPEREEADTVASEEPAAAPEVVENAGSSPVLPDEGNVPRAAMEAPAPLAGEAPGLVEAEPQPDPPAPDTALEPAPEPTEDVVTAMEPPGEDLPGGLPETANPPETSTAPGGIAAPEAEAPPASDPAPEAPAETIDASPEPAEDPALIAEPEDNPTTAPDVVTDRLPSIGATTGEDSDQTAQGPEGDDLADDGPNASDGLADVAPLPSANTGRLPTIGAENGTVEAAEARPAIERNAISYGGDPALPKMAIVLIDEGPGREDVGDLAVMPFPLTVAVDASSPDAETAIRFYRESGAEIVLMVPLPDGATATDVDVTLQVYEPLLEQSVAVLFTQDAGFQSLGDAAKQVVTVLEERGLGLVTYPEGLNTGHKIAVSEGVPATLVFRDLDSDGQAPDVIRRFLDNVAFRARNEDGVTAIARVRPDSLQAILEWSLGNRAQTVNLAPLSATMTD